MSRIKSNSGGQLRWLILLLAIAVILPTVCLLWFMTQAVRNERLAVRQKLIDVYAEKAQYFFVELPDSHSSDFYIQPIKDWAEGYGYGDEPYAMFEVFAAGQGGRYEGMLIYDSSGSVIYPVLDTNVNGEDSELIEPFRQELQGNLEEAVEQYEKAAEEAKSESTRYKALLSKARCLDKLGQGQEAVEILNELSYPEQPAKLDSQTTTQVIHSRVFLAELYSRLNDENLHEHIRIVLGSGRNGDEGPNSSLSTAPAEVIVWQLNKMIGIAQQAGIAGKFEREIEYAKIRISAYENAIEAADIYPDVGRLNKLPSRAVRRIGTRSDLYGLKFYLDDKTILGIESSGAMLKVFAEGIKDVQDDMVGVLIYDNLGQIVAGDVNFVGKPFITREAGGFFGDFEAAVYFKDNSVFENAASRQAAIYIWTSVLVVVLILASGVIAAQAIGRQIRLNRLKNDFIATVTHELKTPLSSMRVLVDTLLEGNYEGEQTATEYLQLISRENERLSHLIDNFLTFSRMERNKQAFEITAVSPVEIANSAAEALRAKFEKNGVDFKREIAKSLPMISADKDAMVTVLVNLLDNAFKYTSEDKRVELKVFREDGFVCFAVKDNGVGMSRRQVSRAFDRFYQADSSLSRRTEGAGLGLSIVKFIVDAHKGQINIFSKPAKGSTFTVKIKACAENGNDTNNRR